MAQALNNSTGNSLLLIDEFGKGTNSVRRNCLSTLWINYMNLCRTRTHSVFNVKQPKMCDLMQENKESFLEAEAQNVPNVCLRTDSMRLYFFYQECLKFDMRIVFHVFMFSCCADLPQNCVLTLKKFFIIWFLPICHKLSFYICSMLCIKMFFSPVWAWNLVFWSWITIKTSMSKILDNKFPSTRSFFPVLLLQTAVVYLALADH